MTIRVHLYASREAVVTVRTWLSRLLRRPAPDPRLAVGDSQGSWFWHATGHRILDSRITRALQHAQDKHDSHQQFLAHLRR